MINCQKKFFQIRTHFFLVILTEIFILKTTMYVSQVGIHLHNKNTKKKGKKTLLLSLRSILR
jgi:hypothetical protein